MRVRVSVVVIVIIRPVDPLIADLYSIQSKRCKIHVWIQTTGHFSFMIYFQQKALRAWIYGWFEVFLFIEYLYSARNINGFFRLLLKLWLDVLFFSHKFVIFLHLKVVNDTKFTIYFWNVWSRELIKIIPGFLGHLYEYERYFNLFNNIISIKV